ncbi:nucleoside-triphosphatase [Ekhidna sp.]
MPSTNCSIYILTGEIQSGKSTALSEWIDDIEKQGMRVGGLLNLVIDSKKWFLDIASKERWSMERLQENDSPINVGRYIFSEKAFDQARKTLNESNAPYDYFIVDEIGKLELKNLGLEPALSHFLEHIQSVSIQNLILVVRDSLVDEVLEKYKLPIKAILEKEDVPSL